MIVRELDVSLGDALRLAGFACSAGASCEDDVESWIRTTAIVWLNDIPRANFQRRSIGLVEEDDELIAVVAWQDITRVDIEGIWLEVLAVGVAHQHGGRGSSVYDLTVEHLRNLDRDGDHLAGLIHMRNLRSHRLLTAKGWQPVATWGDHLLWVGHL